MSKNTFGVHYYAGAMTSFVACICMFNGRIVDVIEKLATSRPLVLMIIDQIAVLTKLILNFTQRLPVGGKPKSFGAENSC